MMMVEIEGKSQEQESLRIWNWKGFRDLG
ncbi:hypothetical protein A2U01_0092300, partial [Trifolium medium]|nr:hypothetical protein [Trifolium medium]